jgi:putative IMPACT (imprinted ancient) family translation regulator
MLDVLRHQGLERVLATVVRYFGGVKLGAGGLVRAYTDAVAQALLHADRILLRDMSTLAVAVPYALEGTARRALAALDTHDLSATHAHGVTLRFRWPTDAVASQQNQLSDMLHGHAQWLDPDDPTADHDTFME